MGDGREAIAREAVAVEVLIRWYDARNQSDHPGERDAASALALADWICAEVEYGVRFLVPHRNAGEAIWLPDLRTAAIILVETPGMAELVQRWVGAWEPLKKVKP